jgi:hypothetical protein
MPACEKCWSDAYIRSLVNGKPQAENYRDLLEERKDTPCSKEQQMGTIDPIDQEVAQLQASIGVTPYTRWLHRRKYDRLAFIRLDTLYADRRDTSASRTTLIAPEET